MTTILEALKVPLMVVGMFVVIGLAIWYEVELWDECLQNNSFMYCMRVLQK